MLSSAVKSDGQSAVAIIYILYFGGGPLSSSSKETTLPLAVEFSLNYLWLLGTVLNAGITSQVCAPPPAKRGTSL